MAMVDAEGAGAGPGFPELEVPRIRHIASIRIHKLRPHPFPSLNPPTHPHATPNDPSSPSLLAHPPDAHTSPSAFDPISSPQLHAQPYSTSPAELSLSARARRISSGSVSTLRGLKDPHFGIPSRNSSTDEDELGELRSTAHGQGNRDAAAGGVVSSSYISPPTHATGHGRTRSASGTVMPGGPTRPGMMHRRSRSRLIVPKLKPSGQEQGPMSPTAGPSGTIHFDPTLPQSSSSANANPLNHSTATTASTSATSPTLASRTARDRSSSISSIRSNHSVLLHPHGTHGHSHLNNLAYRRDRAGTLGTLGSVTAHEEEELIRAEVGERLGRCFVVMSLVEELPKATAELPRKIDGSEEDAITGEAAARPKSKVESVKGMATNGSARRPSSAGTADGRGRGTPVSTHARRGSTSSSTSGGGRRPSTSSVTSESLYTISSGSGTPSRTASPNIGSPLTSPPTSTATSPTRNGERTRGAGQPRVLGGAQGRDAKARSKLASPPSTSNGLGRGGAPLGRHVSGRGGKANGPTGRGAPPAAVSAPGKDKSSPTITIEGDLVAQHPVDPPAPPPPTPFYISPIHSPSTHPTFSGLNPASDFADWLRTEDLASHTVRFEFWVEVRKHVKGDGEAERQGEGQKEDVLEWKKLASQVVDLRLFRELPSSLETLPANSLILSFHNHGDRRYYLPLIGLGLGSTDGTAGTPSPISPKPKTTVQSIMQRSLRETRMQKGVGFAELHALVHLQAVCRETEQETTDVQARLAEIIQGLAKVTSMERAISQERLGLMQLEESIQASQAMARATRERLEERRKEIAGRQRALSEASPRHQQHLASSSDTSAEISSLRTTKRLTWNSAYRHRARCAHILDTVFPIVPVDPQRLLYTILDVPLPIPQNPSDTAPPLSMSSSRLPHGIKVDEESSATALGLVALVVNQLSVIMDRPLLYPVTCAGSRSLVRDYISVIQGPRSFPLYVKGVEKYRYEYAVFLLNKNIETLMVEGGIRIEDMRHTLPNLKTLLLVIASQDRPPAPEIIPSKSKSSSTRPSSPYRFPSNMAMTSSTYPNSLSRQTLERRLSQASTQPYSVESS